MTSNAMPSVRTVQREVLLVILGYAVPLFLTLGSVLTATTGTYDWEPLALFAVFLLLGSADVLITRLATVIRRLWTMRWKMRPSWPRRKGCRRPIGGAIREAILAEAPELAGLTIVIQGNEDYLGVDGKYLLIGSRWIGSVIPGEPLTTEFCFALAHEVRHLAVGRFWILRLFRLLRIGYLAAAGVVFTGLLLNVATIFDDPYRIALTTAAVLAPFVAAALWVVLDFATIALERWLELDADAFSRYRCLERGRDIPCVPSGKTPSLERADSHPPADFRRAALQGLPARRTLARILRMGWLTAVIPLGLCNLFAWTTTDTPDLINAALTVSYLTGVFSVGAAVVASTRLGPGGSHRPFLEAICDTWLRIYIAATRVVGWVMAGCLLALIWKVASDWGQGKPVSYWTSAILIAFVGAVVIYRMAGRDSLPRCWVIAAAVCDACRLSIMVWLLRTSGVLPFFDDLPALGRAMTENADLVARAALDIVTEETGWLTTAALLCGLAAAVTAHLVLRAKAVILR